MLPHFVCLVGLLMFIIKASYWIAFMPPLHGQRQSAVITENNGHRCHFYYRSKRMWRFYMASKGQNTPPPATQCPAPNPPLSIIIPDPHESGIS